MNYLVTGGAGYIGIELVYALASLESTKNIIIYDSMRRSNYNVFGGLRKIKQGLVEFIDSDILDNSTLQATVARSNVIFHLAAEVPDQLTGQNAYIFDQINNWGSSILVQCIENSHSAKTVIYVSSFQVLGSGEVDLRQDKPNPNTFYGLSKLNGERHFLRLVEENYHSVSVVRCPTVYGRSKNLRLGTGLNRLIFDAHFKARISIHGVEEYQAPHIYIDDIITALVHLAGDIKVGVSYMPFQNIMLDELVSGINEVFQNIDIIYLEQDHPVDTLIIKSPSSPIEFAQFSTSSLSENIQKFSNWFIC